MTKGIQDNMRKITIKNFWLGKMWEERPEELKAAMRSKAVGGANVAQGCTDAAVNNTDDYAGIDPAANNRTDCEQ